MSRLSEEDQTRLRYRRELRDMLRWDLIWDGVRDGETVDTVLCVSDFLQVVPGWMEGKYPTDNLGKALQLLRTSNPSWPHEIADHAPNDVDDSEREDTCIDTKRIWWKSYSDTFRREATMMLKRADEIARRPTGQEGVMDWPDDVQLRTAQQSLHLLGLYGSFISEHWYHISHMLPEYAAYFSQDYGGEAESIKYMQEVIESRMTEFVSLKALKAHSLEAVDAEAITTEAAAGINDETPGSLNDDASDLGSTAGPSRKTHKTTNKTKRGKGKAKSSSKTDTVAQVPQIYLTREAVEKVKVLRATAEVIKCSATLLTARTLPDMDATTDLISHAMTRINDNARRLYNVYRGVADVFTTGHLHKFQPISEAAMLSLEKSDKKARNALKKAREQLGKMQNEAVFPTDDMSWTRTLTLSGVVDAFYDRILWDADSYTNYYRIGKRMEEIGRSSERWEDFKEGLKEKKTTYAKPKKLAKGSVYRRQHPRSAHVASESRVEEEQEGSEAEQIDDEGLFSYLNRIRNPPSVVERLKAVPALDKKTLATMPSVDKDGFRLVGSQTSVAKPQNPAPPSQATTDNAATANELAISTLVQDPRPVVEPQDLASLSQATADNATAADQLDIPTLVENARPVLQMSSRGRSLSYGGNTPSGTAAWVDSVHVNDFDIDVEAPRRRKSLSALESESDD